MDQSSSTRTQRLSHVAPPQVLERERGFAILFAVAFFALWSLPVWGALLIPGAMAALVVLYDIYWTTTGTLQRVSRSDLLPAHAAVGGCGLALSLYGRRTYRAAGCRNSKFRRTPRNPQRHAGKPGAERLSERSAPAWYWRWKSARKAPWPRPSSSRPLSSTASAISGSPFTRCCPMRQRARGQLVLRTASGKDTVRPVGLGSITRHGDYHRCRHAPAPALPGPLSLAFLQSDTRARKFYQGYSAARQQHLECTRTDLRL